MCVTGAYNNRGETIQTTLLTLKQLLLHYYNHNCVQLIYLFAHTHNIITHKICRVPAVNHSVQENRRIFHPCPYKSAATDCLEQQSRRKWDLTDSSVVNSRSSHVNKWWQIPVARREWADCSQPRQTLVEKLEWRVGGDCPWSKLSLTEGEAGGNTQERCILVGAGACLCVLCIKYLNTHSTCKLRTFLGSKASPHVLKKKRLLGG